MRLLVEQGPPPLSTRDFSRVEPRTEASGSGESLELIGLSACRCHAG
jgi:hypothetical protein